MNKMIKFLTTASLEQMQEMKKMTKNQSLLDLIDYYIAITSGKLQVEVKHARITKMQSDKNGKIKCDFKYYEPKQH